MNMLNYKKYLFLLIIGASLFVKMYAQDNVGIGTTTPNASAILELSATDKGFLVPRLTTAQRNAITSPATGLIIFNTESGTFEYYSGSSWIQLFSGSFLSLTNGRIFVGNASNQAVAVNLSGDATIDNTGVLTIGNDKITTAKILDGNVTNAKLATGIDAAKLADGSISNTEFQFLNNVSSNIQTQLDSKASSTLNSGNIFVGNVSNVATGVAMSGDATIDNAGVLTIGNDKITTAKILNSNVTNAKLATGIDATKLADGSVNNTEFQYLGNVTSDIQTQLNAKMSNSLTNGNIFVGNGSNVATAVAMSGDATISNTGVLTIGNDKITTAKILDGNVTSAKLATGIDAAKLADGSISNTEFQYLNNVSSNIQTQLNAKMSNALPTGYIFVGDASNIATGVLPSGNISVSETGALNIKVNQITNGMISPVASIDVDKLNQSSTDGDLLRTNGTAVEWWTPNFLTTETVGTGTTAGGDLAGIYPNPTIADNAVTGAKIGIGTTNGDLLYYNGTDWVRLGVGANNEVLSSNGTTPFWSSAASIPTGTNKQTLRYNSSNVLVANSNLINDGTNIGINITDPATRLHIDGGDATAVYSKFTAGTTTGQLAGDGFDVGIDGSGNAVLKQNENLDININNQSVLSVKIAAAGHVEISSAIVYKPNDENNVSINASNKSYVKLSDSGTIAITGGVIGQILIIQKTGAGTATLTDGTGYKLTGNWAGTEDDTIQLIFDGTDWVELSRSIN